MSSAQTAKCSMYSNSHDLKTSRIEHITPILHKLHWLPVCDRLADKISTLWHTSLTGLGPHNLFDISTLYAPSRGLRSSSDTCLLSIHRPITKFYGQCTLHIRCHMSGTNFPLNWGTNLWHLHLNLHLKHTFFTRMNQILPDIVHFWVTCHLLRHKYGLYVNVFIVWFICQLFLYFLCLP